MFEGYRLETTELVPTIDQGVQSFYGKAKVVTKGNVKTLLSYDTPVAEYDTETKQIKRLWRDYSWTTWRHLIAFFYWNRVRGVTAKDWKAGKYDHDVKEKEVKE